MSITRTATGWRVSRQIKPQPRLRTIVDTEDEAKHILKLYERGELDMSTLNQSNRKDVTWSDLYDLTVREKWCHNKTRASEDNARRILTNNLGWSTPAKDLTPLKALELAEDLCAKLGSKNTAGKQLSSVRQMLKTGAALQIVNWPLPKIPHYKQSRTRIRFFDYHAEKMVANVMTQLQEFEHRDLFYVLIDTGLRNLSEGAALLWQDVDLEHKIVRLWEAGTKTSEDRRVHLTQRSFEILSRRREHSGLDLKVFPNVTKVSMRTLWSKVRVALDCDDEDFVWYVCRHTCATRLVQAGVDLRTVQEIMGHKKIETTMRYIQFHAGSLAIAASALDVALERATCHATVPEPATEE
jgi:integrase